MSTQGPSKKVPDTLWRKRGNLEKVKRRLFLVTLK